MGILRTCGKSPPFRQYGLQHGTVGFRLVLGSKVLHSRQPQLQCRFGYALLLGTRGQSTRSYQYGGLRKKKRAKGPDAWEFRYYETVGGSRNRKSTTIGTVEQYRNEAAARQAVAALLLKLNSEAPHIGAVTFAALIDRYVEEELPERFSTRISYLSMVNSHIRSKWADFPLDKVKPMAVEDWLRQLPLAPKSKASFGRIQCQLSLIRSTLPSLLIRSGRH